MSACKRFTQFSLGLTTAVALTFATAATAQELVELKVGSPADTAFSFTPLNIGQEKGIFQKHGVSVEHIGMGGGGKVQQGLAANAIDMSVSGGPELAAVARHQNAKAVAAIANEPRLLVLIVDSRLNAKGTEDLKGVTIGVSNKGSLSDWLVRETSNNLGWGPEGIKTIGLGQSQSEVAAMQNREVDGLVTGIPQSTKLHAEGVSDEIVNFGDTVGSDFHIHIAFATNKLIEENPEAITNFLAGWFETIEWMQDNREEAIALASKQMGTDEELGAVIYDKVMPMMRTDGHFNQAALDRMNASFPELGLLDEPANLDEIVTEDLLPPDHQM